MLMRLLRLVIGLLSLAASPTCALAGPSTTDEELTLSWTDNMLTIHTGELDDEALFFATDPVALDRIGWEIVDAKRGREGLPPVAETGKRGKNPTGAEAFDYRQPQHIAGVGALGLGVCDRTKIDHRVLKPG
jgi:hypothetical protein